MTKRLALLYSDGSIGVLAEGSTIEKATEDRVFSDEGVTDVKDMTRIALADFSILEILYDPAAVEAPRTHCSGCGQPLKPGA